MPVRIAFSSLGCPDWDVPTIAEKAVEFGYDGVELRGKERQHVSPSMKRDQRDEVRRRFADAGIQIIGVTAYTRFAGTSASERQRNEEELRGVVELASELGAPYVRTFVGAPPPGVALATLHRPIAESILRVADSASTAGVTILLETHDSTSRAGELHPILTLAEHPGVGVLWDMAHSFRAGESLDTSLALIGKRLGYVHLKDEYVDEGGKVVHCIPGEGSMPIGPCLDLLRSTGYEGYVCLEWERMWHPEMPPLEAALPRFASIVRNGR